MPAIPLEKPTIDSLRDEVEVDVDALIDDAPLGQNKWGVKVPLEERRAMARLIIEEFLGEGLPLGLALAAVVNADVESGLNAKAVGDSGKSFGLFQLWDKGVGYGMTREQRMDPLQNIQAIVAEYWKVRHRTKQYDPSVDKTITDMSLMEALEIGQPLSRVAGLFTLFVERPANMAEKRDQRDAYTGYLFPSIAGMPANSLVPLAPYVSTWRPGQEEESKWMYGVGSVVAFAAGGYLAYLAYKRFTSARSDA